MSDVKERHMLEGRGNVESAEFPTFQLLARADWTRASDVGLRVRALERDRSQFLGSIHEFVGEPCDNIRIYRHQHAVFIALGQLYQSMVSQYQIGSFRSSPRTFPDRRTLVASHKKHSII
jgi:hypothetical protein